MRTTWICFLSTFVLANSFTYCFADESSDIEKLALEQRGAVMLLKKLGVEISIRPDKSSNGDYEVKRIVVMNLENEKDVDLALLNIEKFSKLEHLTLEGSAISDSRFNKWRINNSLKSLTLSGQKLTGNISISAEVANSLESLRLLRISIEEDMPALEKLGNLKFISFENANVNSKIITTLVKMPNLETIIIVNCQLTDEYLEELQKLPKLKSLAISGGKVTGNGLEKIGKIVTLEKLSLNRIPITDDQVHFLKDLVNLKKLELWNEKSMPHVSRHGRKELIKMLPHLTETSLHTADTK